MGARGELSLYEYLYRRIREDILAGRIAAGEKLPSKRRLAAQLGVSVITVEGAYTQLMAEGYVYARPKRGYYAAELPRALATPEKPASRQLGPAEQAIEEASCAQELIADFTRPSLRAGASAAHLWERALKGAFSQEEQGELFGSHPPQGSLRLRNAIASYLEQARGMKVSPANIVVGAGSQVLCCLAALLVGKGAAVALENPGYPRLSQSYQALGHPVLAVPLDAEGISMSALVASGASVAHVQPSHQFPTGKVMSIARRYQLLSWASAQEGRYIVEDDYDWEFRLAGMPIPSLQSIDALGRVVYLSTFSKSLSSALRISFAVLPDSLIESFHASAGVLGSTVSSVDQLALARVIESGEYQRHLSRYRKQSKEVRDQLIAALQGSRLGPRLSISEEDSGLHFVMGLQDGRSGVELARRALQRGVALAPLESYQMGVPFAQQGDEATFVMQYDGLDASRIEAVVRALEEALGCD